MLELKSDLVRQYALRHASTEVRKTGVYMPEKSLLERAEEIREKRRRGQSRWSFFLILGLFLAAVTVYNSPISGYFKSAEAKSQPASAESSMMEGEAAG